MPSDSIENEENVYAAEALLKDRKKKGKVEYLVKWKGWSTKHNSWEPRENILDERLFAEYDARKTKKNDRKRSSTGSGSKKSPPAKKSKRLSEKATSKPDSDEEDQIGDEDSEPPIPVPSTSKPGNKKASKSSHKKEEKESPSKKKSPIEVTKETEKEEAEKTVEESISTENEKMDVTDNEPSSDNKKEETRVSPDKTDSPKQTEPEKSPEKPKEVVTEQKTPEPTTTPEVIASTSTEEKKRDTTPEVVIERQLDNIESKAEAPKPEPPKPVVEEPVKEPEQPPKVFHGHMTSIQIASSSNGQEERVNMNAFVVSQPGAGGSTEQLQVCENEDLAKIQAIKNEIISETKNWTDASNVRHESFQYNGSHTITEVTVNQHTVPIVEI